MAEPSIIIIFLIEFFQDIFYVIWLAATNAFMIVGIPLLLIITLPIDLLFPTLEVHKVLNQTMFFWSGLIFFLAYIVGILIKNLESVNLDLENARIELIDYDFKSQYPEIVVRRKEIKKLKNLVVYAPNPYPQPTEKFFCQIDNDYHTPETKVYICSKCERYVCASCYQVAKEASMSKCPFCYSQLHLCETKKEKMKEPHTLLAKMKDGYKEIMFVKEVNEW